MKNKKSFWSSVLEVVAEIALTLLCFVLGITFWQQFDIGTVAENLNPELMIFLGVIIFFIVFGIIRLLIYGFKKSKNK